MNHSLYCTAVLGDNGEKLHPLERDSGRRTPKVCEWFEDDDGWHGSCGKEWEFINDGPKENGVNFCMDCGRPVEIMECDDSRREPK